MGKHTDHSTLHQDYMKIIQELQKVQSNTTQKVSEPVKKPKRAQSFPHLAKKPMTQRLTTFHAKSEITLGLNSRKDLIDLGKIMTATQIGPMPSLVPKLPRIPKNIVPHVSVHPKSDESLNANYAEEWKRWIQTVKELGIIGDDETLYSLCDNLQFRLKESSLMQMLISKMKGKSKWNAHSVLKPESRYI